MDSNKKTAIVTGASRGIGRAVAIDLSGEGYNIIGISRNMLDESNRESLAELRKIIESNGVEFAPVQMDLSDIESHHKIVFEIMGKYGRIDLLINNAGIAPDIRLDVLETTPESFDKVMSTNLRGPFFFTQIVAREMVKSVDTDINYSPKIVFITSVSADMTSVNRAEYCISKAGLSMTSKIFADKFAGSGINVYEIRPGIITTDMTAPVKEMYNKKIAEGLIPQNRWGTPVDVSKVVVSIAKGDFDYAAGMIFEISGGMNIRRL